MSSYEKTESTIYLENETRTMFGIRCRGLHLPDITTDEAAVDKLVEKCNRLHLDPDMLGEVVDDFLDSYYSYETCCRT